MGNDELILYEVIPSFLTSEEANTFYDKLIDDTFRAEKKSNTRAAKLKNLAVVYQDTIAEEIKLLHIGETSHKELIRAIVAEKLVLSKEAKTRKDARALVDNYTTQQLFQTGKRYLTIENQIKMVFGKI